MKEQLAQIRAAALAAFEAAGDSAALDALRVQYLPPATPPPWTPSGSSTWAKRASSPPF